MIQRYEYHIQVMMAICHDKHIESSSSSISTLYYYIVHSMCM